MSRFHYALRRNADGMYNEKTGKYDGILDRRSIASGWRSAWHVVDPDKPMDIPKLTLDEERMQAFRAIKANTINGIENPGAAAAVPPGTTSEKPRGLRYSFEHDIADLPSKDFFIKTLDRPHYANEDKDGIPPWMRRRRGTVPARAASRNSQKPQQQQVRNEEPVPPVASSQKQ